MPTISTKNGARIDNRGAAQIATALTTLLADTFALYVKVKNFHWHVSGPHFRDYHLLLDDQATQIFAMMDPIAERARKLECATLRSVGQIARLQRIVDNEADSVAAPEMLVELRDNNVQLAASMHEIHALCHECGDVATASLLENRITKPKAEPGSWPRPPTEVEPGVGF
jgi:starvation-inducible DNA-binding protein